MSEGKRVQLVCSACKTLCEVVIPIVAAAPKPVRYQVRCPNCKTINDPQSAQPKRKGVPAALPAAKRTNSDPAGAPKAVPKAASAAASETPAPVGQRNGHSSSPAFKVERILDQRVRKPGKLEYHIKWLGYDSSHNSWEPEANILDLTLLNAWKQAQTAASTRQGTGPSAAAGNRGGTFAPPVAARKACRKHAKQPKPGRPPVNAPGDGDVAPKSAPGCAGSSSGSTSTAHNTDFLLEDFNIQEATEKIEAKPGRSRGKARMQQQQAPKAWVPPPSAVPAVFKLTQAMPSCVEAYEHALVKPRWEVGDTVEVAWSGKGYEGSWSMADVIALDGRNHAMVRFQEFVDTDGSPLVERMTFNRLRLPPAPRTEPWTPALGERIEGLWNDCWWEGVVREFHPFKGLLFQYDRYANWLWLPLRCTRPRPDLSSYYPEREQPSEECEQGEEGAIPSGLCGRQGCMLRNNHLGLCQVRVAGTRRAHMKEKAELLQQEQLWQEITTSREASVKVAEARAEALLRAEQAGADIKAPRGNRAQWHANFQLDEFSNTARDICVMQQGEAGMRLRGMVVVGPGHTLADVYHMLRTELQIEPTRGAYDVSCYTPHDGKHVALSDTSPQADLFQLLPLRTCHLVLDQATTTVPPPLRAHEQAQPVPKKP